MRFLRRYSSTIYGQYRSFGFKKGLWVGAAMFFVLFISRWVSPQSFPATPESLLTDCVMLAGMLFFAWRYRLTLPEGRVTLKELMLLGLWMGCMASVAYGLLLWLYGVLDNSVVMRFAERRMALILSADTGVQAAENLRLVQAYSAGDWGFIGGFRSAVMSILMNLIAALLFRTEKAPVRERRH